MMTFPEYQKLIMHVLNNRLITLYTIIGVLIAVLLPQDKNQTGIVILHLK